MKITSGLPGQPLTVPVIDCASGDADVVSRNIALAVLESGVVRVRGAFAAADIMAWREQFEQFTLGAVARGKYGYRHWSLGDKRHHFILDIHRQFNKPAFYANPFVYGAARLLLDDDFMLATAAIAHAEPGAAAQAVHRDQAMLFQNAKLNSVIPPVSITVSIPLVATNNIVGGTEFVPGSHRHMQLAKPPAFVPAHAGIGDCILWDSRCYHRGCINPSHTQRPIVLLYYQRPWYFNFKNYTADCEIKITEANLNHVPAIYQHLFDWSRRLFAPPVFVVEPNGECSCGSGLPFAQCHGVP